MEEYFQYAIPIFAVCASALLLVMTLERIFGLLGKITVSGWFVRHRKQWRLRETKRVENVTAEIILRMLGRHARELDKLGSQAAVKSYNQTIEKIMAKYPQAKP